MSTNKVYGDMPNRLRLAELEIRWDYADREYAHGIPERHIAIFEEILNHAVQTSRVVRLSESA